MQPGLFSNVSEVTVPENVAAYRREVVALEHGRITAMKTTESRKSQDHEVRTLRNDELDAVSGGTGPIKSTIYAIGRIEPRFPRL